MNEFGLDIYNFNFILTTTFKRKFQTLPLLFTVQLRFDAIERLKGVLFLRKKIIQITILSIFLSAIIMLLGSLKIVKYLIDSVSSPSQIKGTHGFIYSKLDMYENNVISSGYLFDELCSNNISNALLLVPPDAFSKGIETPLRGDGTDMAQIRQCQCRFICLREDNVVPSVVLFRGGIKTIQSGCYSPVVFTLGPGKSQGVLISSRLNISNKFRPKKPGEVS